MNPAAWQGPQAGAYRRLYYLLLARWLSVPATDHDLAMARALSGEPLDALARSAAVASREALADEFQRLFIGVGGGVLLPYASYYLAGSLQDRPLIDARRAMATLGLRRVAAVREPEDHIATMLEVMAVQLSRDDASKADEFFATHIEPWAGRLFADLSRASPDTVYGVIGELGSWLIEHESRLASARRTQV